MASSLQESDWTNIGNADSTTASSDQTVPGEQIHRNERAKSGAESPVSVREPNERDSLLPGAHREPGEPGPPAPTSSFWKASRHWLIPFWLIASFSRGMTLAPRVEIYTNLACEAYYPDHAHHTHHNTTGTGNFTLAESGVFTTPISYHTFQEIAPTTSFVYRTDAHADERQPDHPILPVADGEDPAMPKERCYSDPVVQAHSAQLQMAVILIMGILSALTTGWWGSVGDRIGRRRIMALSLMGYLFTDVMFLVCAMYAKALVPWGGHKLLLLGPIVEGLLGGCTFQGLLFVGVALGPAFGSVILRYTHQILLIFLISVLISLVNCLYVTFIVPESLTPEAMAAYRAANTAKDSLSDETNGMEELGVVARVRTWLRALFAPLLLFAPHNKDWRLTYVAIAFASVMLSAGAYPMKLLYAEHVFGWSAVELGNYLTFVGTLRAVYLLVTLPLLIKWLKPKHDDPSPTTTTATSETTPLLPTDPSTAVSASGSSTPSPARAKAMIAKDMEFDVRIARVSVLVDAAGNLIFATTSSPVMFSVASALVSLGGGAPPAIQSLSLCLLPNPREDAGKMFGALSMIQAVAATIASPLLFGLFYSLTVEGFPAAIFVLVVSLLLTALVSLLLVRPKKQHPKKSARGRSTRRKRLSSSTSATREASPNEGTASV
ncbi:hypothetical protein FRB96_003442 [Tulasnella sp. 330]|nr:hypothetical protein FRB96_003442 [Tulasnella sp. 330]